MIGGSGASERLDWARAGKNVVALAAVGVGAATHTPAVPFLVVVDLLSALRRQPKDPEAAAFLQRFIERVAEWCRTEGAFLDLGDEPSGWQERLRDRLVTRQIGERRDIVGLFADTVFEPREAAGRAFSEELAAKLVAAIPALVVEAGDRFGVGAAAVAMANGMVATLEKQIRALEPDRRHHGDPALIATYLAKLIARLDRNDLSPSRRRAPRRMTAVSRRLTASKELRPGEKKSVPVDELTDRSSRLVILGGPGSGKSWTARQVAIRAADAALAQLAAGVPLEQIELPLIAACSQVLDASDLLRWDRLINATLRKAAIDPGQARRLRHLLRQSDRLLLVLDGLDEATRPEWDAVNELVEARLPGALRVVLTSRPAAWDDRFLDAADSETSHVWALQPFSAADVHQVVAAWLVDVPSVKARLLTLIDDPKNALGRQAQVPLICAMYCLAARPDDGQTDDNAFEYFAPGRRLELFDRVIQKLLAGSWRDTATPKPSLDQVKAAVRWLEDLAAAGDVPDPAGTGLSNWTDTIPSQGNPPSGTSDYVDHVAPPEPHDDVRDQTRRFIHRSLREHLIAKSLCREPASDVADKVVQHLWFDSDWVEVIPAVLAAHPDADQLVGEVIQRVAHITIRDPSHSLDAVLVKTAGLTRYDAMTPQRNAAVERAIYTTMARKPPERWGKLLAHAHHWPVMATARRRLLAQLADPSLDQGSVRSLGAALADLAPSPQQSRLAAEHLLDRLIAPTHGSAAAVARTVISLTRDDAQIDRCTRRFIDHYAVARPGRPRPGRRRGDDLTQTLVEIAPAGSPQAVHGADHIVDRLGRPHIDAYTASRLALALAELAPHTEQARRCADNILGRIGKSNVSASGINLLAHALSALEPDRNLTRTAANHILRRLADSSLDDTDVIALAGSLESLVPTLDQAQRGAVLIIRRLATGSIAATSPQAIAFAGRILSNLVPSNGQTWLADQLIELLADPDLDPRSSSSVLEDVAKLVSPGTGQARRSTELVLQRLASSDISDSRVFAPLARALAISPMEPDQARRSADLIIEILANPEVNSYAAYLLGAALADVMPNSEQARHGSELIVDFLARTSGLESLDVDPLVEVLVRLGPDTGRILALLVNPETQGAIDGLALAMAKLPLDAELTERAIDHALKRIPTSPAGSYIPRRLARAAAEMTPEAGHAQLAHRFLDLLSNPELQPLAAFFVADILSGLTLDRDHIRLADRLLSLPDLSDTPHLADTLVAVVVPGSTQALKGAQLLLNLVAALGHASLDAPHFAAALVKIAPKVDDVEFVDRILDVLLGNNFTSDGNVHTALLQLARALAKVPRVNDEAASRILAALSSTDIASTVAACLIDALGSYRRTVTFSRWSALWPKS